MKNIFLTVIALFAMVYASQAQTDTMYIMKAGEVIAKYNVTDQMDSIVFYNPAASGTVLAFDASKILTGDLEGNGNFRFEIFNEYGSGTKADPPFAATSVVFDTKIEITFTLSGITLGEGAAGSYSAVLGLADADWSAQYWGGGAGDITVTGDGTYTVWAEVASFDTALVFVIDVKGLGTDLPKDGEGNVTGVTATIDKIVMY